MYDYSGEWAYRVGVPAKSGVSGGVIAIVNPQMAIATYSPRLDARGNSCRGINVCIGLAAQFGLHAFDCVNVGSSFLQSVCVAGSSQSCAVFGITTAWPRPLVRRTM